MAEDLVVTATYLEAELVRVQFQHSHLVSDHPVRMGGGGRGPSPGELMLAAMTSASVLAARSQPGVRAAVSRAGMRADRIGVDGPLQAIAYLGRLWRRVEVEGELASPLDVGVVETLRQGIDLDERVEYRPGSGGPRRPAPKNTVFLANEAVVADLGAEAVITGAAEPSWRINTTALDADTAIVDLGTSLLGVGRSAGLKRGPSPDELLLGALAACTAIYVGRNAGFHDIPAERITVTVRAVRVEDPSAPIAAMQKITEVIGDLSEEEKAKCDHFAGFCAIGETLKRGTEVVDDIVVTASGGQAGRSALAGLAATEPPPAELACDDGSCCISAASPAAALT